MNREKIELPTLYWQNGQLFLLNQKLLPLKVKYVTCKQITDLTTAIKELCVRGAPAIGIAAAFGMVIAAQEAAHLTLDRQARFNYLEDAADQLLATRPTAVNLAWALGRSKKWLELNQESSDEVVIEGLLALAQSIHDEDVSNNRLIGSIGAALVPEQASILTHCNAGALATGGFGTALGVIRAAVEANKKIHVYVDETRPLLQGARITTLEMLQENIPATLITDNCAGYLMSRGLVDLVIVGADRIASNGDTANKIGTYGLAVLAKYHKIPFYVAAPLSTIDQTLESAQGIIIEERDPAEITSLGGQPVAPTGCSAYNPAFDLTPAELITAIITEKGIVTSPNRDKMASLFAAGNQAG